MNRRVVSLVVALSSACGGASATATCPRVGAASASPSATVPSDSASSAAASSAGPLAPPSAWMEAAMRSHGAFDIAQSLADEVGPRLAGSPSDRLAVAWAEKTMRELGLANVHTEPVVVPMWKRGAETAEIVSPSHQTLAVTALGWSGATPKEGIIADVMEVESLDALMKLPKDAAKGKIVFANVVMSRTDDGRGYGMAIPVRSAGPKAAMNAGAAAFLVRSLGTSLDRFPHAGSSALHDVAKPIAAGALSTADAELLHRTLARGAVKMKLVLTPERAPDAASSNVVGEVVGTSKKDEVVLLGAHLDSWDLGRGAIDDGAGCGIVLEAAHLVSARAHPSRTVRVVLFAAEENSAAGAKAYFMAHGADAKSFVLAMEADSGTDRALRVKVLGDPAKLDAFHEIARALAPLAITADDGDARAGTDVSPLVNAGVPTIEVRQDASRYFDTHHSANDTAERLDAAALAQVSAAFAEIAYRVAELDGNLGRVPESKRKPE